MWYICTPSYFIGAWVQLYHMAERVNLCKVSEDLRDRIKEAKGDDSWPDFMETVAEVFENGVVVKTEHMGGRVSQKRLEPGEKHETVGETVAVRVAFAEEQYECERCEEDYSLSKVMLFDDGERTICSDCLNVEERIH